MTQLFSRVLRLTAIGMLTVTVANAALPSASKSTCPGAIRLVGSAAGVPDQIDGRFQVVVHDAGDAPIEGSRVTVSVCAATDLRISQNQLNPAYTVDCVAGTVSALTNVQGIVEFTILGGSITPGHGTSLRGSVRIYADDPQTTTVESVLLSNPSSVTGLTCSAPDLNGTGGLSGSDLSQLLIDMGSPPSVGCWQRSDINGNGIAEGLPGGADFLALQALLGGARMTTSGVACASCQLTTLTLLSIQPNGCGNVAPVTVTLNGANFGNGATAALERPGDTIPGLVTFVNSTTLRVTFDLSGRALGAWDVRVTNPGGATDARVDAFTIAHALQGVSPAFSGNVGTIRLTVTGCGLVDVGSVIRLSRANESDIVGTSMAIVGPDEANAMFEVDGRAIGKWDVTVTSPGGQSSTLVEGFELEPVHPGDLVLTVVGENTNILPNKNPRTKLEVTQTGNVSWQGVAFLALTVSGNVSTPRLRMLSCCASTYTDLFFFPAGPDQLTSLIMLPNVPVGAPVGYELELRRPPSTLWTIGDHVRVCARLYSAREGQEALGAILRSHVSELGDRLAPGNEPALGAAFVTAFQTELGTALTNWIATFSTSYDNDAALAVLQAAHNSLFVRECVETALTSLSGGGFSTQVSAYRSSFWTDVANVLLLDPTCTDPTDPRCFESGQEGDYLSIATPPQPTEHWPDQPTQCWNYSVVGSHDPNAKTGPSGTTATHALRQRQPITYRVGYENVATATAPAQDVVITDQLDVANLDLSTFEWSTTTIGENGYFLPPGLKSTSREIDLRPDRDVIVRVFQHLDVATGLVTCTFHSIDPATGLPPTDPFAGFLPPNLEPPQGEGSISYRVRPKASIVSGVTIANQARIVFDQNPYLDTPVWTNLFDFDAPESHVLPLAGSQGHTSFLVDWAGSDAHSGVFDYTVYVSTNAGPYEAWRRNTALTSDTFVGQNSQSYAFYSVARDSAGNVEPAPATADASTTILVDAGAPRFALAFAGAVPNPTRAGELAVAFTLPDPQRASLELLDIAGRVVARRAVGTLGAGPHTVNLAAGVRLAQGLYHIRLIHGGTVLTRKVVVMR